MFLLKRVKQKFRSDMKEKIIPGCEPLYYEGGKEGCLLLHGFTSSPFELRLLGAALNNAGYTVSVPLLPGHGTSPRNLKKSKWTDWYEEAKMELFRLRKSCTKVYVIGLSMGGSLALHLAAHYEVNGVAALAPGLYLQNRFSPLSHFVHLFFPYKKKRSGVDIKAEEETNSYDKMPVKSLSELLKFFSHLKNDLRDVYVPLLLIHAKEDHVIDGKSAREIYAQVSSKNKRILELQESYHIITLDVEKELVFREIQLFLKEIN
jgi:carboxylesterase